jgi:hypothetical protein
LILPDSNLSQTLCTAAEAYLSLKYSVIPLWGDLDPARPKVAGVDWGIYQRRRSTLPEINQWFLEAGFSGLAIVTGSISQLAVLDFDTAAGFQEFSVQHPDLVKNQVIQTRRGYHIYYRLPPYLRLSSRRGQGVDLLSDGRYVVSRPTCIDGHPYTLIRGGMPKVLTQQDIDSISRYFAHPAGVTAAHTSKREFAAFSFDSGGVDEDLRNPQTPIMSIHDLRQAYLARTHKGRNEALFQTSLQARDVGWSSDQVLAALADLHVRQPSSNHQQETRSQRYMETRKSVLSAFSRPPRHSRQTYAANNDQLPNSVRERLFQLGATKVVRVIEGLRAKGIKPGETFTTNQALELLKGIVGRDSVYGALKVSINQPIFSRENPSPTPPTPADAATNTKTQPNKCFIGSVEKPGKSPNHRSAAVFIMPSNDELCLLLGVKPSRSDPLALDDLTTAKKTRMAVHRELIRRRSGKYPRRWLARRLGIEHETLDTYNREIPIQSRSCFWEQPIFWSNLNAVPEGITVGGAVLMDERGKHYPARRQIAAILLGQGRTVIYKRQDVNYYWYGADISAVETKPDPLIKRHDIKSYQEPTAQRGGYQGQPQVLTARHNTVAPLEPIPPNKPSVAMPPLLNYHKPLPQQNHEILAVRVYETLNSRTSDLARHISRVAARRLVATYSAQAIDAALRLLAKRHNIDRPAGFFVTILRSESKRNLFQPE